MIDFNFNLKTLAIKSGLSFTYWFGKSSLIILGQFGLQVTVINKSGFPYSLTIAIESWYNCCIYLIDPVKDDGRIIQKRGVAIDIDNRWIVPYNPYLSQKYDCHINVEICSSICSVKYLYKYIYKGSDCTIVSIKKDDKNEIANYLNTRYISAIEKCGRLFNFGL